MIKIDLVALRMLELLSRFRISWPCWRTLQQGLFGFMLSSCQMPHAQAQESSDYLQRNVVYGTRFNVPLVMDVAKPEQPNGAGIIAIQSGAWHSNHSDSSIKFPPNHALLLKGYTIFIIWHSNPPLAKVPDAAADVQRAVRFIHANAEQWRINPKRLAAIGASSAGHLSLMLATNGDDGNPDAQDPIERHACRIHTAIAINPPTDLRGWTTNPPEAIAKMDVLRAPLQFDAQLETANSPITLLDQKDASVLLIHGSDDELVPVAHSQNLHAAMNNMRLEVQLQIIPKARHAFTPQQSLQSLSYMAEWLEDKLPPHP